jgi:Terminase RNaseH-like domain/Terminase large subunit, T4likevirus-type, N-terminal
MADQDGSSVVPSASRLKLTVRQEQARKLIRSQRHTLLVGGSRSGKTTLLVHEIAGRALQFDNSRHAILRLHANAARGAIALDTLPKVFRLGFPNEPLTRHRTDGYFSLGNGSEIWIAGLDDHDRVEKILGKEYATIFLNECSQIPYSSVLVALTRLAQVVEGLSQAAYYDLNPTNKGHWTNLLFGEKRDPMSRQPLANPEDYARMFLNPGDNAANLTEAYLKSLENLPERHRKRFFEGVYIDNLDGALFSYEAIARGRVADFALGRCVHIVVAVDPSGAASRDDEAADEIGIVVAARGDDGHAYVLADRSLRDAPAVWGRVAVRAYHEFRADQIIAEENFGGEMVRFVIRAADPHAPVRVISASRGKAQRAEPVSTLYERGIVHHVGRFAVLEDQLCAFTTQGYRGEGSPDRADALVWALTDLMLGQAEGWGVFEYYRQEAAATKADRRSVTTIPAKTVKLRAPDGVSTIHGSSGRSYLVDAVGVVEVTDDDAGPLLAHGFERLDARDAAAEESS